MAKFLRLLFAMHETKHLIATLPWRGLRLSPKYYQEIVRRLPPHASETEIVQSLSGEWRLKLSFERGWFERCLRDLDWLRARGIRMVTILDEDYPDGLREFKDAPLALTVLGSAPWRQLECMSIVGSRNPDPLALRWMDSQLDEFLEHKEICIVSGGARGVDQKAHAMALRKGRPTVCFVPSGLGALYPRQLDEWERPILDSGGALVSTYCPSQEMERGFFIERNRYIAAISQTTLIVEAKRRSGTMVTARWAAALDRPLGALPCSPNANGLGGLDVIVDGGCLIRDYQDLLILAERGRTKSLMLFARNDNQVRSSQ